MMKLILSVLHGKDTFKGIEEELLKILRRKFIELLVEVLEEFDEYLMETRDKEILKVKGIRKRTIVTVFGELTFKRRYYYDSKAEEYRYILDETLNLPRHDRVSNLVKEKVSEKVVVGSTKLNCFQIKKYNLDLTNLDSAALICLRFIPNNRCIIKSLKK